MDIESKVRLEQSRYDPNVSAPVSVFQSIIFANFFSGRRPPATHELNFEQMGIPEEFVIAGKLPDPKVINQTILDNKLIAPLWDRLSVPAFFLEPIAFGRICGERTQIRRFIQTYYTQVNDFLKIDGNVAYCMYFNSYENWKMGPVILADLYKSPEFIKFEIRNTVKIPESELNFELKNLKIDMKTRAYYLRTGQKLN